VAAVPSGLSLTPLRIINNKNETSAGRVVNSVTTERMCTGRMKRSRLTRDNTCHSVACSGQLTKGCSSSSAVGRGPNNSSTKCLACDYKLHSSIKLGEYFDSLSDCYLLNKDSCVCYIRAIHLHPSYSSSLCIVAAFLLSPIFFSAINSILLRLSRFRIHYYH
jgi:hypothetical protein